MRSKDFYVNLATGIAAACSLVVTSVFVYRQFVPQVSALATPALSPRKNRKIPDWQQQIALGRRIGPATAPVTILYYGDFECPACGAFTRRVEEFRKLHPDEVSIVFRHFPLSYHRNAYASARAAECGANQGKFEPIYKALYSTQDSLGRISYRELARRAAVPDLVRFDACISDTTSVARIERDLKAARDTNIPGTPGVIIDGTLMLEKQVSVSDLEQMVKEARRSRK